MSDELKRTELRAWRWGMIASTLLIVVPCCIVAGVFGAGGIGVGPCGSGFGPGAPASAPVPSRTRDAGAPRVAKGRPIGDFTYEELAERNVRFTVSRVVGRAPVEVGAECTAEIRPIPQGAIIEEMTCCAHIGCGMETLRECRHGFFVCDLPLTPTREVTADDPEGPELDGDGTLVIDSRAGAITIHNGRAPGDYVVEGRILAVE